MNAVDCLVCGARIESKHAHDWRRCKCPDESFVFVDGGSEYTRRGWGPKSHWREVTSGRVTKGEETARDEPEHGDDNE